MRKSYIMKRLEEAKRRRMMLGVYVTCPKCLNVSLFLADYSLDEFDFSHQAGPSRCREQRMFLSEEEFVKHLLDRKDDVVRTRLLHP